MTTTSADRKKQRTTLPHIEKFPLELFPLAIIVIIYGVLVVPMIPEAGISFDEQTDLVIAQSYSAESLGWLRGSSLDAINVRLPMFVSWLFFGMGDNDLHIARLVSCFMSGLTLIAVFLYCKKSFNSTTGLLACFIIAINPYFLAFSKVAFTEGDSFITCLTAWLLLCVTHLRENFTLKWVLLTGLCLGLALSAKASGAALVIATSVVLFLPGNKNIQSSEAQTQDASPKFIFSLLSIMGVVLLMVSGGFLLSGASSIAELPASYSNYRNGQVLLHYILTALAWLLAIFFLIRNKTIVVNRLGALLLVLGLAAITFFTLPPVHTTNPAIITSLIDIFVSSSNAFSWFFAVEIAALHFFTLLFKPGILIGFGLWTSLLIAFFRWRTRPALRPLLIFFGIYLAFLIFKMVHAQTFFMMPLFPIAVIIFTDTALTLFRSYRKTVSVILALTFSVTLFDLFLTYPHTHLNGYQWVGERYLAGRSTVGYRGIVQTPSDGVEQTCQWLGDNLPAGERILYYTHFDHHIVTQQLKNKRFILIDGMNPRYTTDMANYILVHINATIHEGRGYQHEPLSGSIYKEFFLEGNLEKDFRKVYSVTRPFGLEVASVWYRKKPYVIDTNGNITGMKTEAEGLERHPLIE